MSDGTSECKSANFIESYSALTGAMGTGCSVPVNSRTPVCRVNWYTKLNQQKVVLEKAASRLLKV